MICTFQHSGLRQARLKAVSWAERADTCESLLGALFMGPPLPSHREVPNLFGLPDYLSLLPAVVGSGDILFSEAWLSFGSLLVVYEWESVLAAKFEPYQRPHRRRYSGLGSHCRAQRARRRLPVACRARKKETRRSRRLRQQRQLREQSRQHVEAGGLLLAAASAVDGSAATAALLRVLSLESVTPPCPCHHCVVDAGPGRHHQRCWASAQRQQPANRGLLLTALLWPMKLMALPHHL